MRRLVLVLLILTFLPQIVAAVISFKVWLSTDQLVFIVGKPMFLNIYINNTGDEEDAYNLTDIRIINVDNPDLVSVTPLREFTDTVKRGEIANIPLRIEVLHVLKRSEGAKIEFKVASLKDPTVQDQISLTISSGIPQSLTELNSFYLLLLILLSSFILVRKFS